MSSSLQIGVDAIADAEPPVQAALLVLGDQPRTRPAVIRALIAAARTSPLSVMTPSYADGGGANPILLRREAFDLVDETSGDRGLGPVLEARPEVVFEVLVAGANPDIDTPADLAALQSIAPA
jgi:molybdenum cofactor cytidylyltransferase